jgi:aromatic ring-opening dioxygenase catalytic subunit (LigB family)
MAKIVFAAGAPHAPAIVGLFDKAPEESKKVISDTYAAISRELREARPDVLIAFANDHLTNNRITFYPDFLIGTAAKHSGPHEWFQEWIGCRDYTTKGNPAVAKALFTGMTRRGVRMSTREENLRFDDNISVPVTMTDLDQTGITLVPVLQNCTVPPFPGGERCFEIGRALRDFIEKDLPSDMRVALFGSGGLSHEPGGVKYYKIDEAFDRRFLELCTRGDHEALLNEMTVDRMEEAGAGGTAELLSWFPVMAAIGERPGRSFGYTGWPSFRCGIGGVIWDL